MCADGFTVDVKQAKDYAKCASELTRIVMDKAKKLSRLAETLCQRLPKAQQPYEHSQDVRFPLG